MNPILLAAMLITPAVATPADLDSLFLVQREEVAQAIRDEMRTDLERRSEHFFAPGGELHELLNGAVMAEASLAAR